MSKNRLEAFSDGVIAIIITIMVLELKIPLGHDFESLKPILPVFLGYVLSFVFIGIYWNNHHHLLQATHKVNGPILWANMHLLFWLSLVPFVTNWMSESNFAALPVALYGVVLFFTAVAYFFLSQTLLAHHGANSTLSKALGSDTKGRISLGIYALAILVSFFVSWLAIVFYIFVTIMWLIPDRRIEETMVK
ncbi:MAG: TMEM175 family protein [Pseudomonadota bacterium]|nr:TMEM175 family protein [Pseudomonadota bacterium]